jgi:hypothetical protein
VIGDFVFSPWAAAVLGGHGAQRLEELVVVSAYSVLARGSSALIDGLMPVGG